MAAIAEVIVDRSGGTVEQLTAKLGTILRSAIDLVVATPKTSRKTLDELEKTEKTYLGTRVEIELRAMLKLPKGRLDLRIDAHDVDVKFTIGGNWMIPAEAVDAICIVIAADESAERCFLGVIRARPAYLTGGGNRDGKKSISAAGFPHILWLVGGEPYPANFWKSVDARRIERIFAAGAGSARLVSLFSEIQDRPIPRSVVEDVAQQLDYMKRLRRNGGARDALEAAGILLLSGKYDGQQIEQLGLPICGPTEFVSTRR